MSSECCSARLGERHDRDCPNAVPQHHFATHIAKHYPEIGFFYVYDNQVFTDGHDAIQAALAGRLLLGDER